MPAIAADTLNDRARLFFHDRGRGYRGRLDKHPSPLYLQLQDMEDIETNARNRRSNAVCERFHKMTLDEFCWTAFREELFDTVEKLHANLDT